MFESTTSKVYAAYLEKELICAFNTPDMCKNYIREKFPNVDPFDVSIKHLYITSLNPDRGGIVPR